MKSCTSHWDELRQAIDQRGLSGLIAGSGEKVCEAIARQLEGIVEPGDFDPLMSANWAIMSAALQCGGLYLMGEDENGNQYCPLCEAAQHGHPGTVAEWITGCCDAQLEHARELGLVPKVPLVS